MRNVVQCLAVYIMLSPLKMLHLNALFFPLRRSGASKKVTKMLDIVHHREAFLREFKAKKNE